MSVTQTELFDTAIQKANLWFKELEEELKWTDRHRAYLALRATLQALRDRLTIEEAAHLGAQLPMIIRGFYYEGWRPDGKALKKMSKADILSRIRDSFRNDPDIDPEQIARAVFRLLSKKISSGEIEDIKRIMPEDLRDLWP